MGALVGLGVGLGALLIWSALATPRAPRPEVRKAGRLGQEEFFRLLRKGTREALAGYISSPALDEEGITDYIVPPGLGDDAGVCGAIALAQLAAARANR